MTRVLIGAAVCLGLGAWLVRLVLGYRAHVPYSEFRKKYATLPDVKRGSL